MHFLNRNLIANTSRFLTNRAKQLAENISSKLSGGDVKTQSDALSAFFGAIKTMFLTMGKPTMKKRYIYENTPPFSKDINDTFSEIYNDTRLIADEEVYLGESFKQSFNYSSMDRQRMRNRLKEIGEKVNDYMVLAKNSAPRTMIAQDSFGNLSKVDIDLVNNAANVDVKNGLVSLGINGSFNNSLEAEVIKMSSNHVEAMPGNFLVCYKKISDANYKTSAMIDGIVDREQETWDMFYNSDPHGAWQAITDESADTWFEFQMINVKDEYKKPGAKPDTKGYNWTYNDGSAIYGGVPNKDYLQLTIVVDLKEEKDINWIDLFPYFPHESSSLRVDDIQTSINNAGDFVSCLDPSERGRRISSNSASPLEVKDRDKFKGHGVWLFSSRPARYIKFILTTESSYVTNIGHIYWELEYDKRTTKKAFWITTSVKDEHFKERVEGRIGRDELISATTQASLGVITGAMAGVVAGAVLGNTICPILGGIIGALVGGIIASGFGTSKEIINQQTRMGLDVYPDGWRWCIGIRGIGINTYTYSPNSVLITKDFTFNNPVKQASLSVSEMIPDEFFSGDVTTKNQWIKYYLSHDSGATWTQISPIERTPAVIGEKFPAKTISFAKEALPMQDVNKQFVIIKEDVKTLRLKVEFYRPEDQEFLTPILYDYKIKTIGKAGDEI